MWIFIDNDYWYWDDSYYLDTSFIDNAVVISNAFVGSDESTDALVTDDDYSFIQIDNVVVIANDFIGSDESTDLSNDELDFSFIDVTIVITDDLVSSDESVDIDLNELDFSFTDDVAALLTDDVIAAQEELEPIGDDLEFSFTGIDDVIVIIDDVIVSSEELAEWIDDSESSFTGLDTIVVVLDSLIISNEDELISLWLDDTNNETSYTDFSTTVSPTVFIKKKYKGAWDSPKRTHIFTRLQWEKPLPKPVKQAINQVAQLDLSSNDAEIALRMRLQAFKWQSEYLDIALALQSALQAQISTSIEQIKQQFDYEHYLEAMRLVTLRQENNRRIILYIMNQ